MIETETERERMIRNMEESLHSLTYRKLGYKAKGKYVKCTGCEKIEWHEYELDEEGMSTTKGNQNFIKIMEEHMKCRPDGKGLPPIWFSY